MSKPVLAKKLDVNKISYTQMNKGKNGGKVMYLQYEGKPLLLQLPKMIIPFAASDYEGNKKFSLNFSFDANNEQHQIVLKALRDLDEKIIQDASDNSKEWFDVSKKRTVEGVRETYQSQIKDPKDDKYQPRLRANLLGDNNGGFRMSLVDMSGTKVPLTEENLSETIPGGSKGTAILECMGIWIVQKTLTLTWKVSKMKYEPGTREDVEFESDSEDDASVVLEAPHPLDESESDDDEVDEVEEDVPIKKIVSRGAKKALVK